MPGPVSDSYDPEFGTGANAGEIFEAIDEVIERIRRQLGPKRRDILDVVRGKPGKQFTWQLSAKELRIIRFCLHRAKESI